MFINSRALPEVKATEKHKAILIMRRISERY